MRTTSILGAVLAVGAEGYPLHLWPSDAAPDGTTITGTAAPAASSGY